MKQFVNAMICTEEGIVRANMAFSDQIVSIGAPPDCVFETVKVPENAMILPGFIDIHTHGAGGKDFRDEDCLAACETISEKLAQEGTTSYLSTLGAQTFEQEILSLKEISAFMRSKGKKGARMLGIHLEGPFLKNTAVDCCSRYYVIRMKKCTANFQLRQKEISDSLRWLRNSTGLWISSAASVGTESLFL